VTRCSNVYGPGDLHLNRLIPAVIKRILSGEKVWVRKGTERIYREYTYVEDVAEAYLLLAQSARPLESGLTAEEAYDQIAYNIGSGEVHTAEQVARTILRLMGRDEEVELEDEYIGPELPSQYLATQKFRLEFPQWEPHSFEEGLQETIEWYQTFLRLKKVKETTPQEQQRRVTVNA
jgi:nucleoside-diphosphate-sugar epimerase